MKKLFCFLAVAATAAFTSCSSDDDSGDNGGTVTGITLNASSSTVTLGDTFTFTVNNNLDENVTSSSTIYVDDTAIEGNTYTATEAGTYTVHAVNGDFTSEDVTVTVTNEVATTLTVAVSAENIAIGEDVTFTAATDISDDVTGDAVFYVNGTAIEGNTYTATEAGEYEVYATLDELTSEVVTFMAVEEATEPNNSFIVDGVNYETPVTQFGYRGVGETAQGSGEYIIVWDFNPFSTEGEGEATTYPNDLYLTLAFPIEPTGEEGGEPTFTITPPTAGEFTYTSETLPSVLDAWIITNNEELLPEDNAERAAAIQEVTLNINSLVLAQNEGETSTLEATYTVTLTNGTVINGDYNGQTGLYGLPQGRNSNISNGNLTNNSGKFSASRK